MPVHYNIDDPKSMDSPPRALAGRRILVVDADQHRARSVADLLASDGAFSHAASALHEALDLLEDADPPFDAAIVADRFADADGVVLARAIRTSPLLFDVRVVILDREAPPEGFDTACIWPASPEMLAAAVTGPISARVDQAVSAPVLDLAELESILGGLTPDLVDMLQRFARQARGLANDATNAALRRDAVAVHDHAHALKGAAFSAGATRLGRAAQSLEAAAAAADWDTAAAIDLMSEVESLTETISDLSISPT